MPRRTWNSRTSAPQGNREATLAHVIETIERHAPETKAEIADLIGLSEHYLSELLGELKSAGVVSKGYVVDREAVYESANTVSELHPADGHTDTDSLLDQLSRLDEVTIDQYAAARDAFAGDEPDLSASRLESLANERCQFIFGTLKSVSLTTDWPGPRVAADLSMVATNMELVGDHSCFIAETVTDHQFESAGVVHTRILDVFELGLSLNDHLGAILYDGNLDRIADLHATERQVHRELDELFELVTAYETSLFGHLTAIIRALERSIYYWVNSAELLVELLTGIEPTHLGQ